MKRSVFTNNDIKEMVKNMFQANTEKVLLMDENGEDRTEVDLYDYLNIDFYVWKNRVLSVDGEMLGYETWATSLNYSLDKAYALVETTNADVVASQDIDSAQITGRITFFIQSNKVNNLDYLVMKTRNAFLGNVQEIQNANGDILNAYVNIGVLLYDDEPETVQVGESLQVSLNFSISYLNKALNYNDTKIYLSLTTNTEDAYKLLPIIKGSFQNIFTGQAYTTQQTPNRIGVVNTGVGQSVTFSFYDFDKELTLQLNEIFWSVGAYSIDGILQESQPVNIPVWLKIVSNGKTYIYKDVIVDILKDITNSDFTTTRLSLKGNAKV